MPNSQYTVYSSSDASSPGFVTGAAGSLLTVLDAVLVNGYGAKAAAGWSKPVANAGNIGCYKNGAGSTGFGVVINDNGPNVTSTFKEAWATGWEVVAGVGAPVGTGTGQFPTPAQLLTTGHVSIRKSTTADATQRGWIAFADKYTLYFHILTGDSAGVYYSFVFGDFFAFRGTADVGRCFIGSSSTENSATSEGWGSSKAVGAGNVVAGFYAARPSGGLGSSTAIGKFGDSAISLTADILDGSMPSVNAPDNSYYLAPVMVSEDIGIRGRCRGVYHYGHIIASATDGQTITGTGDHAGKTFMLIKTIRSGAAGASVLAMEISNTVETN
jgi:hypothetical protein